MTWWRRVVERARRLDATIGYAWCLFWTRIFTSLQEQTLGELHEADRYLNRIETETLNDLLPEARLLLRKLDEQRAELNEIILNAVRHLNDLDKQTARIKQEGRKKQ